jgi:hypothetical protein
MFFLIVSSYRFLKIRSHTPIYRSIQLPTQHSTYQAPQAQLNNHHHHREIMASYQINNILKIDVSDIQCASFSISIDVQEGPDEVHFLDRNPDSHTLETYPDNDRIYVRVTPRYIFSEQFLVEAERDDSTAIHVKREEESEREVEAMAEAADDVYIVGGDGPLGEVHLGELGLSPTRALPKKEEDAGRSVNMSIAPWSPPEDFGEDAVAESDGQEDADDILLIVGEDGLPRNMRPEELALSPVETEPVGEEVADMTPFAPAVPDVDMYVYAAEAPHAEFDNDEEAATDTPAHKHDTRYQRRQRQRQQQPHHRDSISPSRYFSRPYLHQRPAVPPRHRERLQRIARAALRVLDG